MTDERKAFIAQRSGARRRGIGWELTFDQWRAIWQESGKYADRGVGNGKYVMARYWDGGPYRVGNVRIIQATENLLEYHARFRYRRAIRRIVAQGESQWDGDRLDLMDPLALLEAAEAQESLDNLT